MIYLKTKIVEINTALAALLANARLHGLVEPVLVGEELWHYEPDGDEGDWKEAGLWASGENGHDPDTVLYFKVFGEAYDNASSSPGRAQSVANMKVFIRSKHASSHGLVLKTLLQAHGLVVESSDFNKPQIIQNETLRLDMMSIREYVSAISFRIVVPLSALACLQPQSC